MNRRTTAFVMLSFTFLMISAVISTLLSCQKKEEILPETPTTAVTENTTEIKYKTYIIKEYNGLVAVFDSQNTKPIKVTDRYVSSLPEEDRKKLISGIETNSENKLKRLLEDLCS